MGRLIFIGVPKERQVMSEAVVALEELWFYYGSQPTPDVEYRLLSCGYQGVDSARNYLAFKFMEQSTNEDDVLVQLDNDHIHPKDLIERLVAHNVPVVGALAFKRKSPYFPVAYILDSKDNNVKIPIDYPNRLCQVHSVGGAALAIQRKTFQTLVDKGYNWPWFRFTYQDWSLFRSGEDIYFMELCAKLEIPVYCDFSLVTPHLDTQIRDNVDWKHWLAKHPDLVWNGQSIKEELIGNVPGKYIVRSENE